MNSPKHILVAASGVVFAMALQGTPGFSAGPATVQPPALQVQTPGTKPISMATSESASYKNYTYYADRYRDPFVPLTGDIRTDQSLDRPPQIASLMLKGIVQDSRGRMALLTSGISSYVLKGGRLYDGRNRMVKKIAGVIKTESVVLIGADRTIREIKTKSPL